MKYQGLVVFDVDGTLIREKTVCELIAARIDKVERMDWLERNTGSASASTGVPPEQQVINAREEMADWYIEAGRELVDSFLDLAIWASGAHSGIKSLMENGWQVAVASLTWSFGVARVAADLGISDYVGSGLDWDTKQIEHVFPEHKSEFLQRVVAQYEVPAERVYAVGDSGGDLPMMEVAGKGFYLGHSDPQVDGVVHLPDAGIDTVADRILGAT